MSLKKSHPVFYFTFHSTIAIQVFEVGRFYNHRYFIANAKERPPCTVAHTNNQLPTSINNLNWKTNVEIEVQACFLAYLLFATNFIEQFVFFLCLANCSFRLIIMFQPACICIAIWLLNQRGGSKMGRLWSAMIHGWFPSCW